MIKAAILTVSDTCAKEPEQDVSGATIEKMLNENDFQVCAKEIVPDEIEDICSKLIEYSDQLKVDMVFTTGGTGLSPRDVTPEATIDVCQRMVPGFGELMRRKSLEKTKNATLSRATAGIRNNTLVINLPGSPKAVAECLEMILDILPHAKKMMQGKKH